MKNINISCAVCKKPWSIQHNGENIKINPGDEIDVYQTRATIDLRLGLRKCSINNVLFYMHDTIFNDRFAIMNSYDVKTKFYNDK